MTITETSTAFTTLASAEKPFGRFLEDDRRIIGATFDAEKVSYDFALKLRRRPYTMNEFIGDLVAGHIGMSNVGMRRHFVMRALSGSGSLIERDEFERQLLETVAHGSVSSEELAAVDPLVLAELGLNLTLRR